MNSVGTCKWFNGFIHPINQPDHGAEVCAAGVCYKEAFGDKATAYMAPCIDYTVERVNKDGTGRASYGLVAELRRKEWRGPGFPQPLPCGRRCEPTDEENDNDVLETREHFRKMIAVMQFLSKWRVKPKPKGNRDEIKTCPICSAKMRVWQSAYNGHVGAQCETPGCVNLQE